LNNGDLDIIFYFFSGPISRETIHNNRQKKPLPVLPLETFDLHFSSGGQFFAHLALLNPKTNQQICHVKKDSYFSQSSLIK